MSNGRKHKQLYKCSWLWQTGYYAKTKQKGGRGMREGWEYKKLGDLCDIYQPKTLATEQLVADGKYYVYGANGIIGRYNDYNHEQSEILLTCRGATCGTINISQPYSWINGNAMVIHRKSEDLSFDFLKYLMLSLDYSLIITGAAQPQITRQKIAPIIVKFPSLSVQQSIVSELDKINELIRLKKEQLKDFDNLAQSIFYEMFGDEKYERRKLKDIVKVKSGQVSPLEDPYCDMVHVGPANIESNTGRLINLKTAKEENLISGKYLFDSSMVLYSKIRPNLNKVTIADFEGICSADMYPLIPSKSIDKKFLLFILKQKEFLSYAIANSGRANIPKINREALLEYSTILPPLSLQLQFAERLALIEKQKEQISSIIKDLETLLASRMQYWFD